MKALSTNQREQYSHLIRFKECFPDFPAGTMEFGDEPDVIIHTANGLLGIEHTRIFRKDDTDEIVRQEQESLEQRIVDKARSIYENGGGPPLYVTLAFIPAIKLAKNEVNSISSRIASIVRDHIPNEGQHHILDACQLPAKYLPRQISAVFVDRFYNQREMFWAVMRSDNIPNISSEQIQEIIHNKDIHVRKYLERCSEVWLVIVQDGFAPSSGFDLSEGVLMKVYKSAFKRVFLFRNFEYETHELKVRV